MSKIHVIIFVLLTSSASTGLSQNVTWTANTNARQVLVNGIFSVSFTLKNTGGSNVKYPSFEGFDVISGPATETSMSIVNGRQSNSITFRFSLMAIKTGKYTIDPATITVDNRTMRTNPLSIEVVEGKPGSSVDGTQMPTDEQIYLKAEMDTSTHFPGEQVTVRYRLYTSVNIRNYSPVKEDDYNEFVHRYVKDYDDVVKTEVIDGIQYRVQTLKSVALFPTKAGIYEIDPFIVNVGISAGGQQRRSFFFSSRSVPKTVRSNSLTLRVAELPENKPEWYTGAVGHFAMEAVPEMRKLTTDDALIVNVQIASDGDARKWAVPELEYLSDRFEVYKPNIKEDKTQDERGRIINRKEVQYLLVPREPGPQVFTIDLPYFNPDSAKYLIMKSSPISIRVTKGKGVKGIVSDIGMERDVALLNDLISPDKHRTAAPVFLFSPLFFLLGFAPFVYLVVIWRKKTAEDEYAGLDLAERKRLEARQAAMKHLEDAKIVIDEPGRGYFEVLSEALFIYISGKLQIPHSELSKDNIAARMSSAGLNDALQEEAMSIINDCQMILYAGKAADDSAMRHSLYERTVAFILSVEDGLNS